MASRGRAENRKKYPNVERLALSVDEFCAMGNFSRSYYESEKRAGRGPKETYLGKAIRITPTNAQTWLADRTSK